MVNEIFKKRMEQMTVEDAYFINKLGYEFTIERGQVTKIEAVTEDSTEV